ncbi:hypothetical protein GGI14_000564 [Coemansia sp. S680]|nr:hypothetical protein GGI14_000564 [Coemansia sp. S680]
MYATTANRRGRHGLGGTRRPWAVHNISNLNNCLWKWRPVHIGQTSNYNPDISDFANQHAQLVEIERNVNIEDMTRLLSTKSTTELALVKRLSADQNATLVTLMPFVTDGSLPNTILRTSDIVKIDEAANDHVIKPFDVECTYIVSGTIMSITGSKLVIHFSSKNDIPGHWDERCSVTKLVLDVPYKRMFVALDSLANFVSIRPSLHYVVFSNVALTFHGRPPLDCDFVNKSLNQLQREAVHLAMTADNIALIHGLPGTGKMQVLVEIIHQTLAQNQRILNMV